MTRAAAATGKRGAQPARGEFATRSCPPMPCDQGVPLALTVAVTFAAGPCWSGWHCGQADDGSEAVQERIQRIHSPADIHRGDRFRYRLPGAPEGPHAVLSRRRRADEANEGLAVRDRGQAIGARAVAEARIAAAIAGLSADARALEAPPARPPV